MTFISAVIITKDEEKNISRCLDSVKGIADEILVCDSGSTDRTLELAKASGARVITVPWKGFAETKNDANGQATGDYILSLDADEALSEELRNLIRDRKNNLSGAYSFKRLNNYCG